MSGAVRDTNRIAPHDVAPSYDRDKPIHDEAPAASLSLVIPAWNEQESIEQAIREADTALSRVAAAYEIIVVDDGSTDGTAALVRAESDLNPRVRLVAHSKNRGYGAALRTGFEAARCELVAFTDADCQFDLHDLKHMLPLAARHDAVCGYRADRQDRVSRCFYSWGYNALVRCLLGSPIHDVDCALKLFRRDAVMAILPESDDFFANAEMMTKARTLDLAVTQVSVRHRVRASGRSKVTLSAIPRTLATLLPFWWSRVLFPAHRPAAAKLGNMFWLGLLLVAAVAAGLLLPNLSHPLLEPDEGRYAEIAREMVASGDWLVPTLYYQNYYDKPPLFYWAVASSFKVFGVSEWSARLVSVGAALVTILATYIFGARWLGTRAAILSALVLTLSVGFVQFGRVLILDGLLCATVTLSLVAAFEALQGDRLRWPWWLVSAICCGLGVLVKGPVAFVLLVPPVACYSWLTRARVRARVGQWLAYSAVVVCVASVWFVPITLRDPWFLHHFLWRHHVQRFFGANYHPHPIWFFVPVLLLACMPWSLLSVPFARFLFARSPVAAAHRPQPLGYFLLWSGWCVLFFSLSRGKLPPYVLPALPAIALSLGWFLDLVLFEQSARELVESISARVPRLVLAVLCGCAVGVNVGTWILRLPHRSQFLLESLVWGAVILAAALLGRRLSAKFAWAVCFVAALAVNVESAHRLVPAWAERNSPLSRAKQTARLLQESDIAVACYGREWGSVAFRFGREDILNFSTQPQERLSEFLRAHPRTLVFVKRTADLNWFRAAVPEGMDLNEIERVADATIALAAPASRWTPAPALSSLNTQELRR